LQKVHTISRTTADRSTWWGVYFTFFSTPLHRHYSGPIFACSLEASLVVGFREVLQPSSDIPSACTAFTHSFSCNSVHLPLTHVILLAISETMHHQRRVTVKEQQEQNWRQRVTLYYMTLQKTQNSARDLAEAIMTG